MRCSTRPSSTRTSRSPSVRPKPDFRVYLVRGRQWTLRASESQLDAARRIARSALNAEPEVDRVRIIRDFAVVETLDRDMISRL